MAESKFQPDSEPVLQDGTGTPYLAIFNGSGQPIKDPLTELPIGVYTTDFEYNYEEEKEDWGHLILECDNPDIVALPELKYQMPLQLQWGYIYPSKKANCSPIRRVIVIGKEVEFTPDGVKTTINFADSTILSKNISATYNGQDGGFNEYVKNLLTGRLMGVQLVDYNPNAYVAVKKIFKKLPNKPTD